MSLTYLRRELTNRRKQTVIIAVGMALAIALVVIVSSISSGVKAAQSSVLESVYGVGTDITVSKTATATDGGRPSFDFGSDSGDGSSTDADGKTDLSQSTLTVERGKSTLAASNVTKVAGTTGVSSATGVLELTENSFSGSIASGSSGTSSDSGTSPDSGTTSGSSSDSGGGSQSGEAPSGGFGGGSFSFDQTTVDGVSTSTTDVGPLSSTEVSSGRTLTASDAGKDVVVLDSSYAKTESKSVGDTVTMGGTDFTVVGIVASTGSSSTTAADMYIPLDTAQELSDQTDEVTTIYVSATSSSDVSTVQSALESKLSGVTVSTEADLASSVSGSLSTASSLVSNLGKWLSIVVLAAAFLIAILFTISGVTRRTREFGTLKAIGWSNGRITRQVAGESLVQGLIGGVIGAAVGLVGILVVNLVSPTISGGSSTATQGAPGAASTASAAADVVLHAPVTVEVILLAIGLSVLGGLLAGAMGGWRASRLRPAAALRSAA